MYRISVFVSGRGSNLKAILNYFSDSEKEVEVVAVISNKTDCPAFKIAKQNSIKTYSVSSSTKDNYLSYDDLAIQLIELNVNFIVLAGFLKKIPDSFIDKFEKRIINIHPALLPSFGGKGMYGMNVHRAVFEKSAQVSGVTVHFVDKIYDNGKIIAQKAVDIADVNSPEEIAERVLKVEHEILPYVIGKFAEGKVIEKNNRIYILT